MPLLCERTGKGNARPSHPPKPTQPTQTNTKTKHKDQTQPAKVEQSQRPSRAHRSGALLGPARQYLRISWFPLEALLLFFFFLGGGGQMGANSTSFVWAIVSIVSFVWEKFKGDINTCLL